MAEIDQELEQEFLPPIVADLRMDPWYAFVQLGPYMVDRARLAVANDADSYRGFNVGAAILAASAEDPFPKVISGANYKPAPDSPKFCAERDALRKAQQEGYDRVFGIVITGPHQPDQTSGLDHPTLHPCVECRKAFVSSPLVHDDTMIMTNEENADAYELYSVAELLALHQAQLDGDEEFPPMYHFEDPNFDRWFASRATYGFLLNNWGRLKEKPPVTNTAELARFSVRATTI